MSSIEAKFSEVVNWYASAQFQDPIICLAESASVVSEQVKQEYFDYILTDPPFGSNIFYADCSFLWEAWLGCFTDERYEAVWNKSRKPEHGGKTLADYERLMTEAFGEMHRVLKPGRWASVVFHNSDDRVWNAIRDAATNAGFSLENAVYFDKAQRSFKGVKGEKGLERVSNFDIVLNLRKAPARVRAAGPSLALDDAQEQIVTLVQAHLRSLAEDGAVGGTGSDQQRTTQFIHSRVIQALMTAGEPVDGVSYAAVETTLRSFFRQVDGRWYLPGEEVRQLAPQLLPDIRDETTAVEWLRRELEVGPQLEGNLVDAFRVASVKARLTKDVRRILEENFTFDQRRGRWRLPTPAELDRKMDVTRQALQTRVRRYLAEPSARPAATLAAWVRECYQRELYAEAHALFGHISPDDLDAAVYAELRKLDRVAGMRAAEAPLQERLLD